MLTRAALTEVEWRQFYRRRCPYPTIPASPTINPKNDTPYAPKLNKKPASTTRSTIAKMTRKLTNNMKKPRIINPSGDNSCIRPIYLFICLPVYLSTDITNKPLHVLATA